MKKLLTLLFACSMMVFVACNSSAPAEEGTDGENTEVAEDAEASGCDIEGCCGDKAEGESCKEGCTSACCADKATSEDAEAHSCDESCKENGCSHHSETSEDAEAAACGDDCEKECCNKA